MTVIAVVSAVTDLKFGKIFNWVTFPGMALGVILSMIQAGPSGAGTAILGAVIAFGIFSWMFFLGYMGAGDVKLLMAFGALGGIRYVVHVGILSILIGGAFAAVILIWRGRFREFVNKLVTSAMTFLLKDLKPQFPVVDKKLRMAFGVPIAIAAIWAWYGNPLEGWLSINF